MGQALGRAINVTEYIFPALPPTYDDSLEYLVKIGTEADLDVPAALLAPSVEDKRTLGSLATICVIYFHPNAADIGECVTEMEMIRDGAFDGDAIVLAPEYPGYGLLLEYAPTMEGIDRVAIAAWSYTIKELGFPPERVVLWGRSIGCGPSANLAVSVAKSRVAASDEQKEPPLRPVGGVVLVAPMISIIKVAEAHTNALAASLVTPLWEVQSLIADPSLKDVPLCILHPAEDEIIPPCHGAAVLETCSARHRLGIWLRGATHNFVLQEEHLERTGDFLSAQLGLVRGDCTSLQVERLQQSDVQGDDPDEDDRQEIISRLVWWSVSGRADTLRQ